ncbi:hypothetical protein MPLA_430023 [Mesorhizobium sp. ORS 3359]|nr:hypothetical protein MPLA_430023 [Mesorhizobium sp. ORS 3359]
MARVIREVPRASDLGRMPKGLLSLFCRAPDNYMLSESAGTKSGRQVLRAQFPRVVALGHARSKSVGHEVHSLTGSVRPMDGI